MAIIYKITNQVNGQSYIGKTIRPLHVRYKEHKKDCAEYLNTDKTTVPLYNAVGVYGWECFTIETIESNISLDEINAKEQYYIQFYDTYNSGYNATTGGDGGRTSSKLDDNTVKQIIQLLLKKDNLLSMPQIAKEFGISPSVVSRINSGDTWYDSNLSYPLRNYSVAGLTIEQDEYRNIIDALKNTNMPLKEIAKTYNLSESQITSINNGYECYNGSHPYYCLIYKGPFPIRKTNCHIDITDNLQGILYDIIFTNDSMAKIGEKYGVQGNTLTYIANGKRRKELTCDFITPLRKNITANQEIYNKKYSQRG